MNLPARRRAFAPLAAALVTSLVLTGCSQAEKQHDVDALRHSIPTHGAALVAGTLQLTLTSASISGDRQVPVHTGATEIIPFLAAPAQRRFALLSTRGVPLLLVSNRTLYAQRTTQSPHERRPWLRLELAHVDNVSSPDLLELMQVSGPAHFVVLSPQLLLDLLSGALTGSVRKTGQDYRFNVSLDKATRTLKLSEDTSKDRLKVLRSLAISDDISPASATLRPDGTLAKLTLTFTSRPDKQAAIREQAVLTTQPMTDAAVPPTLAVPERSTTIRVSTLGDIFAALAARLGAT